MNKVRLNIKTNEAIEAIRSVLDTNRGCNIALKDIPRPSFLADPVDRWFLKVMLSAAILEIVLVKGNEDSTKALYRGLLPHQVEIIDIYEPHSMNDHNTFKFLSMIA